MTDMSDILTSNGGDVSIRYQYKKELDEQRKKKHILTPQKVKKIFGGKIYVCRKKQVKREVWIDGDI